MGITIPVIILSTLTGTANFAIDGFVPAGDDDLKRYIQAGIGGISIFAGILTTLGNFLRFAQGSEAHRVASIAWGKFQRQVAVELAIHPNDRLDCMDFLKICRAELDRLIEQSPPIPDSVIKEFEREFREKVNIKKPEICDGMEHTKVFRDVNSQLKMLSTEAALAILHKKKLLRQEIIPDIEKLIDSVLDKRATLPKPAFVPSRSTSVDNTTDWRRTRLETNIQPKGYPKPAEATGQIFHKRILENTIDNPLVSIEVKEEVPIPTPDSS